MPSLRPSLILAAAAVVLLAPSLVLGTLITHSSPQNLTWAAQFSEQFRVSDLAERVIAAAARLCYEAQLSHVPNPRIESEDHYYNAKHSGLFRLGVHPRLLSEDILVRMLEAMVPFVSGVAADELGTDVSWTSTPAELATAGEG